MGRAERKIEIVTRLLEAAWVNLEAAHDVILVTENGGEDFFTWDEKDEFDAIAARARTMVETMRSRVPRK